MISSRLNYFPSPHLQISSQWGLGLEHTFGGGTIIQSIANANIIKRGKVSPPLYYYWLPINWCHCFYKEKNGSTKVESLA